MLEVLSISDHRSSDQGFGKIRTSLLATAGTLCLVAPVFGHFQCQRWDVLYLLSLFQLAFHTGQIPVAMPTLPHLMINHNIYLFRIF